MPKKRKGVKGKGAKQLHNLKNNLRKRSIKRTRQQVEQAVKATIASYAKPPNYAPPRKIGDLRAVEGLPDASILHDYITVEMEQKLANVTVVHGAHPIGSGRFTAQWGYHIDWSNIKGNLMAPTPGKDMDGMPANISDLLRTIMRDFDFSDPSFPAPEHHCLGNIYMRSRSQGIHWHFDHGQFGPGVVIVSLLNDVTLTFRKGNAMIHVPLPRRSIFFFWGAARYEWDHAIVSRYSALPERVSITFRSVVGA